jgi:hypothetical protein
MENPDKTGRLELVPNVDTLIEETGSVNAANLEVISQCVGDRCEKCSIIVAVSEEIF